MIGIASNPEYTPTCLHVCAFYWPLAVLTPRMSSARLSPTSLVDLGSCNIIDSEDLKSPFFKSKTLQ
ncbi:hypothetical protein QYF36_004770 [Acer negundo]|nr:hypothetical protein QYF36_004770 [Acer negundo]